MVPCSFAMHRTLQQEEAQLREPQPVVDVLPEPVLEVAGKQRDAVGISVAVNVYDHGCQLFRDVLPGRLVAVWAGWSNDHNTLRGADLIVDVGIERTGRHGCRCPVRVPERAGPDLVGGRIGQWLITGNQEILVIGETGVARQLEYCAVSRFRLAVAIHGIVEPVAVTHHEVRTWDEIDPGLTVEVDEDRAAA